MHIIDQGGNKLDPKSKKCTFIDYGEDEFGYRLWDNENERMICSRDVIFNERISIIANEELYLEQLDVKTTFFMET